MSSGTCTFRLETVYYNNIPVAPAAVAAEAADDALVAADEAAAAAAAAPEDPAYYDRLVLNYINRSRSRLHGMCT